MRTIYFFYGEMAIVCLLTIYAKGDQEDLRPADKKLGRVSWQPSRERPAND